MFQQTFAASSRGINVILIHIMATEHLAEEFTSLRIQILLAILIKTRMLVF
jgi:hypothetical protein